MFNAYRRTVILGLVSSFSISCQNSSDPRHNSDMLVATQAQFQVTAALSPAVSTVGVVRWSINVPKLDEAHIEFGLDERYGYLAPVNLRIPEYRTLLLGMKPMQTYHFRVVARSGYHQYVSEDYTLETGPMPIGLPTKRVETVDVGAIGVQFMIAASFNSVQSNYAFIMDQDADYVWWHRSMNTHVDLVRARMTYDGTHMLIANANVPVGDQGVLVEVSMDGMRERFFSLPFRHHDVTALPDNGIAYIEYDMDGAGVCDRVMEMAADGTIREVFRIRDYFSHREISMREWCHSNAIAYEQREDAYYLSVLDFNSILKIDRKNGALLWVLGGDDSDFSGVRWDAQHQFDVLDEGVLIFSNRGDATGDVFASPSFGIELLLNDVSMQADMVWSYSNGNLNSMVLGDAKRLPNGNTLMVYSASGAIHEVNHSKEMVRSISWGLGEAIGYVSLRDSLYGHSDR